MSANNSALLAIAAEPRALVVAYKVPGTMDLGTRQLHEDFEGETWLDLRHTHAKALSSSNSK